MMFLRGFILGLAIAAPVGPIGILCIQRTLALGRTVGLVTGLGAASADALYGSVAAFGITLIATFLIDQQAWLQPIGGLFLIWLGWRILRTPSLGDFGRETPKTGLMGAYFSTFILTLTNPLTILSFAAAFSGLGLVNQNSGFIQASWMVAGVFLGSAAWWSVLSGTVTLLRGRLKPGFLGWINRISGIILVALGVTAVVTQFITVFRSS